MKAISVLILAIAGFGCSTFQSPRSPDGCHVEIETGVMVCQKRPPADDCTAIEDRVYICGELRKKLKMK